MAPDSLPSLAALLQAHHIRPRKSLGQHFLLDEHLCADIAALAGDITGLNVLEIGPGPGGLTRAIAARKPARLLVIEKDEAVIPLLQQIQAYSDVVMEIHQTDALTQSLTALCEPPRCIIANLPYNVGTELLLRWLSDLIADAHSYQHLTLMFQKEVAERLMAQPCSKAYGRLSVLAQWLCDITPMMELPPEWFTPPPKVASMVVHLRPLPQPRYEASAETLQQVCAIAFQQRRKMLRSALKPLGEAFMQKVMATPLDLELRPDQVSIEGYCQLARLL